jgi:predicted metal-dependent HD superfamily phosphohydrolase
MQDQLPPFVIYHGVDHTYDVHASVLRLCQLEKLDEYNTNLIRAAAWLHDAGIMVKFEDHEVISARFADDYLPQFGFTPDEISLVKNMILATRPPAGCQYPQREDTLRCRPRLPWQERLLYNRAEAQARVVAGWK